ncbi:hypothetical protein D3C80_1696270 [compost metagenome]
MNGYAAYPHRLPGGRYWAMIRVCREAHPAPVMAGEDRPKVFDTRGEAAEECLKHVVAFMNGRPIRGETFEIEKPVTAVRAKAEMLFAGGGRVIQVERV